MRDRKKHAEARRCVRQQVRAAKDAWFQRKAAEEIWRQVGVALHQGHSAR